MGNLGSASRHFITVVVNAPTALPSRSNSDARKAERKRLLPSAGRAPCLQEAPRRLGNRIFLRLGAPPKKRDGKRFIRHLHKGTKDTVRRYLMENVGHGEGIREDSFLGRRRLEWNVVR